MGHRVRNNIIFLPDYTIWKLGRNNSNIGAVAESSSNLAKVMTAIVPSNGPQKRILEVGAGTGVFTKKILKKLGPDDHLDVVELTPELCKVLDHSFSGDKRVTIFCGDILDWQPNSHYDYIISSLPFNAFPAELIKKITEKYVAMARSGALCTFFEYKWLPTIRPLFMKQKDSKAYKESRREIENFVCRFKIWKESAYFNAPPANVHLLQINK